MNNMDDIKLCIDHLSKEREVIEKRRDSVPPTSYEGAKAHGEVLGLSSGIGFLEGLLTAWQIERAVMRTSFNIETGRFEVLAGNEVVADYETAAEAEADLEVGA